MPEDSFFSRLKRRLGVVRGDESEPAPEVAAPPLVLSSDEDLPAPVRFDADWYLMAYPDAADLVAEGTFASAAAHYLEVGSREARSPNVYFREAAYLAEHPEVAQAVADGEYVCGFQHFAADGFAEGRWANSLWVMEGWYRATYPDADRLIRDGRYRDAYHHYLLVGAAEGRDPLPAFSETWYRREYRDEALPSIRSGRYLCGYQHFLETGIEQGLNPHPAYREESYLEWHPDIDRLVRRGAWRHGYLHLIMDGLAEGRQWRNPPHLSSVREVALSHARCELVDFLASDRVLDLGCDGAAEVSVVLVLFNRAELTLRCLEALHAAAAPRFETIIVDNGSSDLTERLLERVDGAEIVRNADNLGFIRGCNQGVARAGAGAILFLNNDAEVGPDAIAVALSALRRRPGAGAVGGRLIRPDGRLEEAGCIVWSDGSIDAYGAADHPLSGAYRFPREVDYCSGAFLMVDATALDKLGGFSTDFVPAYYEDVDLCFRLRSELGLVTLYEPRAAVRHFGSGSVVDARSTEDLARTNRFLFRARHSQALDAQPRHREAPFCVASERERYRLRFLVIDDLIPVDDEGSGCPRMREIIGVLRDLGHFVTVFTSNRFPAAGPETIRHPGESGFEIISHLGVDEFEEFWQQRGHAYSTVIVSRPHNMAWLGEQAIDFGAAELVYDAEALISPRLVRQREVLGELASEAFTVSLEQEIELAQAADVVWTVSDADARLLRGHVHGVTVVSHAVQTEPGDAGWAKRRGLLFLGRLNEDNTPNVDGLRWFLGEVLEPLRELLGDTVPVTVIGRLGDVDLPRPEAVDFAGRLEDLAPSFANARLFVAPARFAAGIPIKVLTASGYGLPTVASSILVEQLGWVAGEEIVDGGNGEAGVFARAVAALYQDPERWQSIRESALRRVAKDCSAEAFRAAVVRGLPGGGGDS